MLSTASALLRGRFFDNSVEQSGYRDEVLQTAIYAGPAGPSIYRPSVSVALYGELIAD